MESISAFLPRVQPISVSRVTDNNHRARNHHLAAEYGEGLFQGKTISDRAKGWIEIASQIPAGIVRGMRTNTVAATSTTLETVAR